MTGERHLIALLTVLQFLHILDFVLMMPLGPAIMADRHLGTTAFAVLVSSYTFASGVTGVLGAFVLDRWARRPALLAATIGFTLGTIGMGLAPDYGTMLAARITAGACGGLMGSLVMILISEEVPYERRGAAMGMVMTAFSLASVLGIPLGVALAAGGGWHVPFLVLGAVAAGVLGWAWAALPPGRGHLAGAPLPAREVLGTILGDAEHRRVLVLVAVLQIAGFTVIPFISPYLVGNHGFTPAHLATFYAIGGVASAVTAPLIGRWSDRTGKHRAFAVTALLSLVPLLLLTHLPAWPMVACYAVTTAFMVLVSGRMIPVQALITAAIQPRRRGAVMSFVAAVQAAAAGVAALIAGMVVVQTEHGALDGFGTVGVLAAGATLTALVLVRRVRPAVVAPG